MQPNWPILLLDKSNDNKLWSKFLKMVYALIDVILLFLNRYLEKVLLFLTILANDSIYVSPYLKLL